MHQSDSEHAGTGGPRPAPVHVVVLAAGKGSRLGPLGEETPKWLVRVGERTIAERQLEAVDLARAETPGSVGSLRVVAGHAREAIEAYLGQRPEDIGVVENPDYEEINNWYSVLLALRALPEEQDPRLVVINGDLFARPAWYASFIADAALTDEESLVAVDLQRDLTDESMKVAASPGDPELLGTIGKVGIDDPVGEYVGMLMARGSVLTAFRERLETFLGSEQSRDEWYERAVGLTAAAGVRWKIWGTPDGDWVEIDDDGDYEKAALLARRF